jgi:hypothetical protein
MWHCTKCRESLEDSFNVCWSCGTSKEGVEDPSFQRAEDVAATPIDIAAEPRPPTATPAAGLTEHVIQAAERGTRASHALTSNCPHCGGADLVRAVKLSHPTEAGSIGLQYWRLLIFGGAETLYADLCKGCGSVVRLYVHEVERNWITG